MNAITMVLIAFAGISLVVSLIMICIITYTSVLERTKEIGVLRALGARKKDITRVFDAETCILGVFSGTLGVLIAWLGTFPINSIIENMTDLKNVATLRACGSAGGNQHDPNHAGRSHSGKDGIPEGCCGSTALRITNRKTQKAAFD